MHSLAAWAKKMILLFFKIKINEIKSTIYGEIILWYVSTMSIT